jgi:hypothetical protein
MENLVLNLGAYQLSLAVSREGKEPVVALKPVCEAVGLDWKTQLRRTQNNPQFRCGHMTIPSAGGPQETLCIPVCQVGMWLCTINANRVKEEIRPKLLAFQEHLQVVIHEHLQGNLTMERLKKLEDVIAHMTILIHELQDDNAELRQQLQVTSMLDRTLVSNAGRQLAAYKAAKKLIN